MNYILICLSVYYAVVAAITFNKMMDESENQKEAGWATYFAISCLLWPIMFLIVDISDWIKEKQE